MKKAVLFGYILLAFEYAEGMDRDTRAEGLSTEQMLAVSEILAFEYAESMDRDTRADKLSAEQRLALSEIGPHTNYVQSSSEIDVVQYDEYGRIILNLSRLPEDKLSKDVLLRYTNNEILNQVIKVIVSDRVTEICDKCFFGFTRLEQVEFEPNSVLARIGCEAFKETALEKVNIPGNVRELCRECFSQCRYLRRVTFGSASKLERICDGAFFLALALESISIPDDVIELGPSCFVWCRSLRCVTFGSAPKLEHIDWFAFSNSGIESFSMPDSVRKLGESCFYGCRRLRCVTFGRNSKLERIDKDAFKDTSIAQINAPERLQEMLKQHCPDAKLVLVN